MTPKDFVYKYLTFAKATERSKGIPALVTLTQAAVESKWGDVAPGYNFFGVKSPTGVKDRQLLLTHEYLNNPNGKFLVIKSIVQVAQRRWEYTVYDYFRKYQTPEDGFNDHADFLIKNGRYTEALKQKDPILMLQEIAKSGYATDPNYASILTRVAEMIKKYL